MSRMDKSISSMTRYKSVTRGIPSPRTAYLRDHPFQVNHGWDYSWRQLCLRQGRGLCSSTLCVFILQKTHKHVHTHSRTYRETPHTLRHRHTHMHTDGGRHTHRVNRRCRLCVTLYRLPVKRCITLKSYYVE